MKLSKKECLPQQMLQNGATLQDLEFCFGVKAKRCVEHFNLVSLKYDQINSPMSSELVQQSRGIILDENDNWKVVARPLDKFFNLGESNAAKIDWASARVQEKLDGTCCILYHYNGKWNVATLGLPDAGGEVSTGVSGWTYRELFWWVWNELGYKIPGKEWNDWTFIFELCTPFNRVVVRHPSNRIVFISARRLDGTEELVGNEEFPVHMYGWESVKEYPLQTLKEVQATFEKLDPLDIEGYVVLDAHLNRIKVKHPGYVALHHLRGNGYGTRRILDVVRKGEVAEILASFPEWENDFAMMIARYSDLVAHLEVEYAKLKDIPLQKAFAAEALKTRLSGALFAVRNGKSPSIRDFLKDMNLDTLLITLEL